MMDGISVDHDVRFDPQHLNEVVLIHKDAPKDSHARQVFILRHWENARVGCRGQVFFANLEAIVEQEKGKGRTVRVAEYAQETLRNVQCPEDCVQLKHLCAAAARIAYLKRM